MEEKAYKEVKPGLWEPKDLPTVVKLDEDFAEQVYIQLKSGSKKIDQKVKTVISQVQKALEQDKER